MKKKINVNVSILNKKKLKRVLVDSSPNYKIVQDHLMFLIENAQREIEKCKERIRIYRKNMKTAKELLNEFNKKD